MIRHRLKKFAIFEICVRYRLCRRDFLLTLVLVGTILPFLLYCVYLRQATLHVQYYQTEDLIVNGSSQIVNASENALLAVTTIKSWSRTSVIQQLCSNTSPYLVGPLEELLESNHTDPEITAKLLMAASLHVHKGGWWRPTKCYPRYHVAIIIPFRDRLEHLAILLQRLHLILQRQQLDYRIFVPEQAGADIFNKARLMNLAFAYVTKNFPMYNCIIFHDVDMIPEDDRNLYICGSQPRHLSPAVNEMNYTLPYHELIGGVLALRPEHFRKVNGYSNLYWGWGGEDDDMYYRMEEEKLKIERPGSDIGRYTMMVHDKREAMPGKIRYKLVWSAKKRYKKDGLAQINQLNYTVLSVTEEPAYTGILINIGAKA